MNIRENCEHRHTNGNCLFNGGFCLANGEEHCVRINEIKSYNQALEDMRKAILTDKELQFAPYSQEMWFKNRVMDIAERLTK